MIRFPTLRSSCREAVARYAYLSVVCWGSSELSAHARQLIDDTDNEAWLSIASIWEIAVKVSIGKMNLHQPFELFINDQMAVNKINLLNLTIPHTAVMSTLPFRHKDPFDRLLIVQAMAEGIPIISRGSMFDAYNVQRLW